MKTNYDIADLVERVKKKDTLAMRLLYESFATAMLTLSFRITGNKTDAEDVLQEAFLKSFQQIHKLKIPGNYPAWLKRIVVNDSIGATRKQRRFEEVEDRVDDQIGETDDHWYKNVPLNKIKEAIGQLPSGCREVFTLYLLEGYKHKEVAAVLNISVSTSKSQYRYSLKLMKAMLIKYK